MLPRALTTTALLTAAVLAAGCGDGASDDLEALRSRVTEQQETEERLLSRLEEAEERIEALESAGPDDDLPERVDELAGDVGELDESLSAERGAREGLAEELESATGDVRSTVSGLQGEVEELRAELEDLRTRYEVLQDRVDEQSG